MNHIIIFPFFNFVPFIMFFNLLTTLQTSKCSMDIYV